MAHRVIPVKVRLAAHVHDQPSNVRPDFLLARTRHLLHRAHVLEHGWPHPEDCRSVSPSLGWPDDLQVRPRRQEALLILGELRQPRHLGAERSLAQLQLENGGHLALRHPAVRVGHCLVVGQGQERRLHSPAKPLLVGRGQRGREIKAVEAAVRQGRALRVATRRCGDAAELEDARDDEADRGAVGVDLEIGGALDSDLGLEARVRLSGALS